MSKIVGISRPSALAVLRLIHSSRSEAEQLAREHRLAIFNLSKMKSIEGKHGKGKEGKASARSRSGTEGGSRNLSAS
jgi:hypothetical protein